MSIGFDHLFLNSNVVRPTAATIITDLFDKSHAAVVCPTTPATTALSVSDIGPLPPADADGHISPYPYDTPAQVQWEEDAGSSSGLGSAGDDNTAAASLFDFPPVPPPAPRLVSREWTEDRDDVLSFPAPFGDAFGYGYGPDLSQGYGYGDEDDGPLALALAPAPPSPAPRSPLPWPSPSSCMLKAPRLKTMTLAFSSPSVASFGASLAPSAPADEDRRQIAVPLEGTRPSLAPRYSALGLDLTGLVSNQAQIVPAFMAAPAPAATPVPVSVPPSPPMSPQPFKPAKRRFASLSADEPLPAPPMRTVSARRDKGATAAAGLDPAYEQYLRTACRSQELSRKVAHWWQAVAAATADLAPGPSGPPSPAGPVPARPTSPPPARGSTTPPAPVSDGTGDSRRSCDAGTGGLELGRELAVQLGGIAVMDAGMAPSGNAHTGAWPPRLARARTAMLAAVDSPWAGADAARRRRRRQFAPAR